MIPSSNDSLHPVSNCTGPRLGLGQALKLAAKGWKFCQLKLAPHAPVVLSVDPSESSTSTVNSTDIVVVPVVPVVLLHVTLNPPEPTVAAADTSPLLDVVSFTVNEVCTPPLPPEVGTLGNGIVNDPLLSVPVIVTG